jgi:dephospho-CoA kinase
MLAERGAVIIDADAIVREVQAPGGVAYQGIVDRFGPQVVSQDGTLDRPALAAIVFADDAARVELQALTLPYVGLEIQARIAAQRDTDNVVVFDFALLTPSSRETYGLTAVIVVDCPVEEAVKRLVAYRGFSEEDARARIAVQISREERRAMADLVLDNGGDVEALAAQVEACWAWLLGLRGAV